jgi:choline-phosphate cytidylyltransferase
VNNSNALGRATTSDDRRPVRPEPTQPVNIETVPLRPPGEPTPAAPSAAAFNPAALTANDIQNFVKKVIEGESSRTYKINKPPADRPVRIYADGTCSSKFSAVYSSLSLTTGVYDLFHFG